MSNPEKEEKRAQLRAARIEEMRQSAERLKNDQDRMRQLVGVSMILENKKNCEIQM